MVDQIQLLVPADVSGAVNRNGNGEGGALELLSGCPSWAIAQYEAGYPDSLHAKHFSPMLSVELSRTMFDQLGVRRDTNMGAWE